MWKSTLTFAAALFAAVPAMAAEQTVDAFATWSGRGEVYQTGVNEASFVGALSGSVYLETEKGPVRGGQMSCPLVIKIDTTTAKQVGAGSCTFIARDGAHLYSDWSCSGVHTLGCDGVFKITGGSGRLDGVSGEGPISLRSELYEIVVDLSDGAVTEAATGIAVWRGLKIVTPDAAE